MFDNNTQKKSTGQLVDYTSQYDVYVRDGHWSCMAADRMLEILQEMLTHYKSKKAHARVGSIMNVVDKILDKSQQDLQSIKVKSSLPANQSGGDGGYTWVQSHGDIVPIEAVKENR